MDNNHIKNPKVFLRNLFKVAVHEADPFFKIIPYLPNKPKGRLIVIGAGKASARMAEAVEEHYNSLEGIVIVPYGYSRNCKNISIIEAAHPVPDKNGMEATRRIVDMVSKLSSQDLVIALISGGGSSLLIKPIQGITLKEKQQINSELLKSGAPIDQINSVRKQISSVKGGKLAKSCFPARVISFLVSDIPKDRPDLIASGPTIDTNDNNIENVNKILKKWNIELTSKVLQAIKKTSIKTNMIKTENSYKIIASPSQSLEAIIKNVRNFNCDVHYLGDSLEGNARELGVYQARLAKKLASTKLESDDSILILSGGECTVTVSGSGSGGPNAEFVLSAAIELNGEPNIYVISCDSDGEDGGEKVAGAVAWPTIISEAKKQNLDPNKSLIKNDSHSFFKKMDAQIITGPTFTNVNDIRAILIL